MTGSTRGFSGLGGDAPIEIDMDEEVRLSYESVKNVDVLDVSPGNSSPISDSSADARRGLGNLVHG